MISMEGVCKAEALNICIALSGERASVVVPKKSGERHNRWI
jgi:hypothetical protein